MVLTYATKYINTIYRAIGGSRFVWAILFFLFLSSCFASPRDLVDETTQNLITELKLKESSIKRDKKLGQRIVLKHVEPIFDFVGMSRFSFGRPWKEANTSQKKRVVESLKQIWLNQYTDNMMEYLDSKITTVSRNSSSSGKKTIVRSIVSHQGKKTNLDYRMWKQSSGWKIYDVLVDGISLLINYRDQLRDYSQNHSVEETVKMLEDKAKNY